jgi:hypothetical protein
VHQALVLHLLFYAFKELFKQIVLFVLRRQMSQRQVPQRQPQRQPHVTFLRWVRPALDSTQERSTKKCSYSVVTCFTEFCKETSFHGFKYITEEGRHWIER